MTVSEERAVALLIDRATEGLTPELESELEDLLASLPGLDPEPFELAAAAIELACTVPDEPMPARLSHRLGLQVPL